MTKRELITKWGGMIAASWAEEIETGKPKRPTKSYEDYENFVVECKNNGYVDGTREELWNKAITYAERLDYKSMLPLQKVRLKMGLSQSQLADKSEINIRLLQSYESGARSLKKASYENVKKLADALGVTPEDIVEL